MYGYGDLANGINHNFTGGTDQFSGYPTPSSNYDAQRAGRALAEAAHRYGIKVFANIATGNLFWTTEPIPTRTHVG